jgi:DNA-binding transcriptional MerR regulator/effector-binding domain-containing protein
MLSIGEFSRVTQLSIKALRLYHEKGILLPTKIDRDSKYRYYQRSAVEKGLAIKKLKDMGFSLKEIKQIVRQCSEDHQVVEYVETKLKEVEQTIHEYEDLKTKLSLFLENTENQAAVHSDHIQGEMIPDVLICGIRFKGKYNEVGPPYARLGKVCGRLAVGHAFSLYYDEGYKEKDADIETCIPVKKEVSADGIDCRLLKGGNAVTLIHRGPYQELGRSYMRIFEYCREHGLETLLPVREQYIKGPGMIFKGNPKKYITKLILMLD